MVVVGGAVVSVILGHFQVEAAEAAEAALQLAFEGEAFVGEAFEGEAFEVVKAAAAAMLAALQFVVAAFPVVVAYAAVADGQVRVPKACPKYLLQ